jgi:hypothetical protein
MHVSEEMNDVLRSRQQRQLSLNADAVKTVLYKNQEALKELREGFQRSPPVRRFGRTTRNHLSWRPVESTAYSLCFAIASPWVFKGVALG